MTTAKPPARLDVQDCELTIPPVSCPIVGVFKIELNQSLLDTADIRMAWAGRA
jgi:hypothetical protein